MKFYTLIVVALLTAIITIALMMMHRAMYFITLAYIAVGIFSLVGMGLLACGVRGDTLDDSGVPAASRAWFIIGGVLLQLPLIGYTIFVWKQGLFRS